MEKLISEFSIGLFFWQTVIFVILIFILKKYAWKPILESIKNREESINDALNQAENARGEMARLQGENEQLLADARQERDAMLKEAKELKEKIVGEAKSLADEEAKKMIARAQDEITKQKSAAMEELKKEIASFSVQIAEKLVADKLENNEAQQALISTHLGELTKKAEA
ncbi:MAG: F0F1 ATP synthase subunit B [Bacteroidia bacterium]